MTLARTRPEAVELSLLQLDVGSPEPGKPRPFTMEAYTGAPFDWCGMAAVIDLEGLEVPGDGVPILRGHDLGRFVGRSQKITNEKGRLTISGVLFDGVQDADEVGRISDQGGRWQASIRVDPDHDAIDYVGMENTIEVNGRTLSGPVEVIRKGRLVEASFTPMGRDPATSALALEAKKEAKMPAPTTADPVAAERARATEIRREFAGRDADFALEAIDKGWSLLEAKAAWADRLQVKLDEQGKAEETQAAKLQRELDEAKARAERAEAALAKPSPASLLGGRAAPAAGQPASDDPVERWELALQAEVEALEKKGDQGMRRVGLALSEGCNRRAQAVQNLARRDPELHKAYVAEVNRRGIGARTRKPQR